MNKVYGTRIPIGENTEWLVHDDSILREIDTLRVVGKGQCVAVFELTDHKDAALPAEKVRCMEAYVAGYEGYCAKRWDKATRHFETCLDSIPDDGPAKTMLSSSLGYKQAPPPGNCDCVYAATSK